MTVSAAKTIRFALTGALGVALLAGASGGTAAPSVQRSVEQAQAALAKGKPDRAILIAEQAVTATPRESALRAVLAQAYLKAGRFEAAATTFEDAIELGDDSARTALGLSLAHAGCGRDQDALAILDQHRDKIPAEDFGLALALSGETGRGVAVLTDALRAGPTTPKLRQNLAYAYALDGRWAEARLMAQQDVPADQVGARRNVHRGGEVDAAEHHAGIGGRRAQRDAHLLAGVQPDAGGSDQGLQSALAQHAGRESTA